MTKELNKKIIENLDILKSIKKEKKKETLEEISIEKLEKKGYKFLTSYETIAIFGKGKDRFLYQRIEGFEPIYKFIIKYKDTSRGIQLKNENQNNN